MKETLIFTFEGSFIEKISYAVFSLICDVPYRVKVYYNLSLYY